jgi:hypothetical protein
MPGNKYTSAPSLFFDLVILFRVHCSLVQYRISSSCVPPSVIPYPTLRLSLCSFPSTFRFFVKLVFCALVPYALFPGVLFVVVREIARCIISCAMAINTSFVQLCCYGERTKF